MSLPVPSTLTPSKVAAFKDCALAFRFSAIDRLPEPPSPATAKGTIVHLALERLFARHEAGSRTVEAALTELDVAASEVLAGEEYACLGLDAADALAQAEPLVRNYFELEDPNQVRAVGLELRLEARLGSMRLRGIIDRLDLGPDGELTVVDYKTGRAPGLAYEQNKLAGVQFYAFLCEQQLGRRPVRVRLLHLAEPVAIESMPTDQSLRGLAMRASAVWAAVERACALEDFRPKVGKLCDWCAYRAYCPAWGGDPSLAVTDAGIGAGIGVGVAAGVGAGEPVPA